MQNGRTNEWIPNIVMGKDYDESYADAPIHYERLESLAGFFARDMPVHRHAQYLQIHYTDSGSTSFHIDDRIYHVEGPSCFLTPASVPHSFSTEDKTTGHVLTVHQSVVWRLMQDGLQNLSSLNLGQGICLNSAGYNPIQLIQWAQIKQLFSSINLEWHSDYPAKNLMLENLTRLLIIQIARLSSNCPSYSKASNEALQIFRRFTDLIDDHYTEHWSLSSYDAALGVSESRLNQISRKIANSPPKKLINDRLMQEAKRFLSFSNLTVKEISYQLGFIDPAYFCRFFRRNASMTAQQYRKHGSVGKLQSAPS